MSYLLKCVGAPRRNPYRGARTRTHSAHTQSQTNYLQMGFLSGLQSVHESRDCRYAVYDVQYQTSEGGRRGKLAFIHFCPDEASIKRKVGMEVRIQ